MNVAFKFFVAIRSIILPKLFLDVSSEVNDQVASLKLSPDDGDIRTNTEALEHSRTQRKMTMAMWESL